MNIPDEKLVDWVSAASVVHFDVDSVLESQSVKDDSNYTQLFLIPEGESHCGGEAEEDERCNNQNVERDIL